MKISKIWSKNILKKRLALLISIVILIIAIIIGLNTFIVMQSKSEKLGFENIGELATQAAYCTSTQILDKSRNLFGIQIPFTESKLIYSYDTTIKAGIDFSDIDLSVNNQTKTIKIRLPEAKVLSNEIDLNSFKVYHEDESIFTQVKLKDSNSSLKELKETAEKDAINNGLLDNAAENAKNIIKSFIGNAYDLEEYKITFYN